MSSVSGEGLRLAEAGERQDSAVVVDHSGAVSQPDEDHASSASQWYVVNCHDPADPVIPALPGITSTSSELIHFCQP
jgi:hypothetical protein